MSLASTSTMSLEKGTVRAVESESLDNTLETQVSPARKAFLVFIVAWVALCTCIGSTSLFPATEMIVSDLHSSATTIEISNAVVIFVMGISSFLWTPVSSFIGQRPAYNLAILCLMAFCIGTALAPTMEVFIAMRTLAALEGTWFYVGGQDMIARLFIPTQRGTAVGFYLAATVIGPALGPCIGGIVVTYTSWRVIFWIQAGMTALGLILSVFFLPTFSSQEENQTSSARSFCSILDKMNPWPVLKLLVIPRVLLAHLSCGLLAFAMYALLVSPHAVLDTLRIDSLILGGVFYLAPGSGFLIGTIWGGRHADAVVRKYVHRRGVRIAEDRLRAAFPGSLVLIPLALLCYGWFAQYSITGIIIPAIAAFVSGIGIMSAFTALNTYAVECVPDQRLQIVTGKYLVQYTFAAVASGATAPLINVIKVGPTSTIGAVCALLAGLLVVVITKISRPLEKSVEETPEPSP